MGTHYRAWKGQPIRDGMVDRIESDLEFAGRLTEEQRSKLLEIAQKCPVHPTLVSETEIRTRLL